MSIRRIIPKDYTVLIVDDSPANIQVLGSVLREFGFNFEYATSGEQALQRLAMLDVDLVLLDIMMPNMDGFEVCTIIRNDNQYDDIPVIFLTAKADKESVVIGLGVGGNDYVVKPFDVNELLARVSTHLELRSHRKHLKDANALLELKVQERTAQLEKSRVKAEESDRLKSVFLANMSHEIRTPMNGILGFTGILKDSEISDEERSEYLTVIEDCGKHLLTIINDIVDISRVEAGLVKVTKQVVDINKQLNESYRFFKPETDEKGLDLVCLFDETLEDPLVYTDSEKLYALFTNLIKNAIKFTDDGSVTFGYKFKEDCLEFFVRDTGVGISLDQQKFVFERFRQVTGENQVFHEGNGLGLSIAKAYVDMLDGRIWVESVLGEGSTFYFSLPVERC